MWTFGAIVLSCSTFFRSVWVGQEECMMDDEWELCKRAERRRVCYEGAPLFQGTSLSTSLSSFQRIASCCFRRLGFGGEVEDVWDSDA